MGELVGEEAEEEEREENGRRALSDRAHRLKCLARQATT